MPYDLLIKNVRPMGGNTTDVLIQDGLFHQIGPGLAPDKPDSESIDGNGCLLIPGLVDGHMHLDKTFLGLPWVSHQAGPTTFDRIESEKVVRRKMRISVKEQAGNLIRLAISKGTTQIRTHVDVDPEIELSHMEALLAAREEFKDSISIQLVAFPQSGVIRCPGTTELLEEAVKAGADLIGGIDPAGIDQDAVGQLDAIFSIAARHGVGVDIHLHDRGELGVHQIGLIAERTQSHGLKGRVAISHAYCLGMVEDSQIGRAIELLVENGISIMTTGAAHSPVPPVERLHDAGVLVFSGSDGIRDAWTPFGNADMLEKAMLVALRFNFRTDEGLELAFQIATQDGAQALGLEGYWYKKDNAGELDSLGSTGYGTTVGCSGDAVLVDAENIQEAIVNRPPRKLVVKAGRIVARDGVVLI
ncbi:MAG: amidohydrolase family protein [SAR324 cluster bacterium]|nr:amidohydrolase family protein [SAR324 cluster bacterium]